MLLPWLTFFDLGILFYNLKKEIPIKYNQVSNDFVILIPIFNHLSYLKNIDFLKQYSSKVIICTTNQETKEFYTELNEICNNYGFKHIRISLDNLKNPWSIYKKTLLSHDLVLGKTLKEIKSKYVIFLDGDTICNIDLGILTGNFEKRNLDLASVRIMPSSRKSLMEKLQYIEYHIAMKARKIHPWLTSGACMIGKRDILIKVMDKHSLFFSGGDIEIGKLSHLYGYKIGNFQFTFYTDIPSEFRQWFKQRKSWFCGSFRHAIVNVHTNTFSPFILLYTFIILYAFLPFKIYELIVHWYIALGLMGFYFIFNLVTNWEIRTPYMLLFPLYALFQVIVMPILGVYTYIETALKTKNFGIMKIHYKHGHRWYRHVINWSMIAIGLIIVANVDKIARYI